MINKGLIKDTNEEVSCWNDLSTFRATVLSIPWSISEEDRVMMLALAKGVRRGTSTHHHRRRRRHHRDGGGDNSKR